MSSICVLFWFDVEDYITPESDEALKGLLEIFEGRGAQATWKLVGERARVLETRGRSDIVRLLQRQDIGYHTDTHSQHPVIAEYLGDLGWEDGVAEVRRREAPGYGDLVRICGPASTFGQAGGSWGPQIYPVLRELEIPLFMDEASHVGLDSGPFWYGGVLHINRLRENCTRMQFKDGRDGLGCGCREFQAICERLRPGGGLVSIFYHPCEWATDAFWDGVNFARGAQPPRQEWKPAPVRTAAQRRTGLDLFDEYLAFVQEQPDVAVITGRQVLGLLPDRSRQRRFSMAEVAELTDFDGGQVTFRQLDGAALAPSEVFVLTCAAMAAAGGIHPEAQSGLAPDFLSLPVPGAEVPSEAPLLGLRNTPYGPARRGTSTVAAGTPLPARVLAEAAADALGFVALHGRMPDTVWLGSEQVAPADFLVTAAGLLARQVAGGDPGSVPLRTGALALEHHIPDRPWGWVIFPEGFDAPAIIELARLQTWTLKPALLQRQEGLQ